MSKILISGLINIETTLKVESFPITYTPVRYPFFGIQSSVAGVGYNIALALTTLGDQIDLLSLIGQDFAGNLVIQELKTQHIASNFVVPAVAQTAQSVILYDPHGTRSINTDLKNIQQQTYPPELALQALSQCELAVLGNINFSRPLLAQAKALNIPIATDVHTIASLDDEYNHDFMQAAQILFMSDAQLPCSPEEWALQVQQRFATPIIVIGLGSQGALLALKEEGLITRLPAVSTRQIVNTIGAGDALLSAFLHFYVQTHNAYESLQKAQIFASYKIGTSGAAAGFLTEEEVLSYLS